MKRGKYFRTGSVRNSEGYMDTTAYEGIRRADESERLRHSKVIGCILRVCELAGYSVEGRIVLKDNKTGRVWK